MFKLIFYDFIFRGELYIFMYNVVSLSALLPKNQKNQEQNLPTRAEEFTPLWIHLIYCVLPGICQWNYQPKKCSKLKA